MKKLIIAITFFLFHTTLCHAQFQIGIVGGTAVTGLNISKESSTISEINSPNDAAQYRQGSYSKRLAGYGGLALNYKITNNFSINTKLLYSIRGWKEKGELDSTDLNFTTFNTDTTNRSPFNDLYTLQYFELPLQFTFYAPVGKTQVYWGVGPYLAYAIGGYYEGRTISNDSTGFVNYNHPQTSNSLHGNKIDYGFDLSAGLLLRCGLSLDFSYMAGIRDMLTDRFYFLANRNRTFHFGLTYYVKSFKK